ncbi:hypothetical protein TSAR_002895 [Trichomalopsis sarcophagae]|uniref:Uncharacterized protein n=1 Tax=Trichomalopsis sarcophagae TaxID=543379 RepID=A0A232ET16_9HYME|nr:hypothetical protein TSAR_002895 [Trichomalopsis sarcophagae]
MTPRSRRALSRTFSESKLISSSSSEGQRRTSRMADVKTPVRTDVSKTSIDESRELSGAALPLAVSGGETHAIMRQPAKQHGNGVDTISMASLEKRLLGLEMGADNAPKNIWGSVGEPLTIAERVEIDARCQAGVSNLMNIAGVVRKTPAAAGASSGAPSVNAGNVASAEVYRSRDSDALPNAVSAIIEQTALRVDDPPHIEGYISEARARSWIRKEIAEQSRASSRRQSFSSARSNAMRAPLGKWLQKARVRQQLWQQF